MKASANAPAKINLYLDVMQKRPDSFHDIKSIMHTVRLSDTVTVETKSGGGIRLSCSNPELPTGSRNLAFRAAELFFERTGIDVSCEIHIEKNIPVAGGLAGGKLFRQMPPLWLKRIFALFILYGAWRYLT